MRPKVERIEYPAVRELLLAAPTSAQHLAPNCYTIDHDMREWTRQGKQFTMHKTERVYSSTGKSASATDFYNMDQGSKMSLAHRVQRSAYRFSQMRATSAGRASDGTYLGTVCGTPERVGPGAYAVGYSRYYPTAGGKNICHDHVMPRAEPGSSPFASGLPRDGGKTGGLVKKGSEPGYSAIATDRALWNRHANLQQKGRSFEKTIRFQRPPGPGSNLPGTKPNPGPGSYAKLHSWPEKGFRGSSLGYNHNSSVG